MANAKIADSPGRIRLLIQSLLCLGIAYALASWAIDNGQLWTYGLGLIVLIFAIRYGFQTATFNHGKNSK